MCVVLDVTLPVRTSQRNLLQKKFIDTTDIDKKLFFKKPVDSSEDRTLKMYVNKFENISVNSDHHCLNSKKSWKLSDFVQCVDWRIIKY